MVLPSNNDNHTIFILPSFFPTLKTPNLLQICFPMKKDVAINSSATFKASQLQGGQRNRLINAIQRNS